MTVFKVVDTQAGISIAHLEVPDGAETVHPKPAPSQIRADKLLTYYIENDESMGWGPVEGRTTYSIGKVTEADRLETDEFAVSGAGLHAFKSRGDATKWMRHADL